MDETPISRDTAQLILGLFTLGDATAVTALLVLAVLLFLAWVLSSDARTRRLSNLMRSRNGGSRR